MSDVLAHLSSASEWTVLGPFALALLAWTLLAGAEATLAAARDVARTAAGPRQLGELFYELHRHPRRLVIALALGRELALVTAAALGASAGYRYDGLRGGVAVVVATAIAILVLRGAAAGIAKRRLARGHATIGPALGWMLAPLRGLAAALKTVGRALAHGFLGEAPSGDNVFAPEEMAALSRESESELVDAERALVAKAVRFGERSVRHVLTPRRDIVSVPADIAPADLLTVMRAYGFSRLPVHRGEKEDVVGFLYVKDVLGVALGADGIGPLLRQPYVVQAEKPVGELFREFRARKVHIALVLDEYGSLVGLVTMEDLLEELFGEMRDELDENEEPAIRRRGPGTFLVSGRVSVEELNARLKLALPPSEDGTTIAGMVMDRMGRVPAVGESVDMDGCRMTVEELDGPAVALVRVQRWSSSSSR
ncbi:MAG: HlyC/CorC family transporter [Deltaproteobacteria bacterium]|nr:HlyC/CorC family transporter [Deltaproteobacteria bacterium]